MGKLREDGFLPSFQTTECARGGFMSRNAPVTDTPLQFSTFDESKTTTHYAKDCRGTVLMKNNTLRMSYRAPEEPRPHLLPEGGVSLKGRPSSDVTKGFENLYERSYY